MSSNKQQGFTLIELMAVTIVLGVLALVALPAYTTYQDRSRFNEAIVALSNYQSSVGLRTQAGEFTSLTQVDAGANGVPEGQTRTETNHGIEVNDGVLTVTWKADGTGLDGVTYTLALHSHMAPVQWNEGGTCGPLGYC